MTMTSTGVDTTYNGWANYHTWNVALYIQNDYGLYQWAKEYRHHGYQAFAEALNESEITITDDGVSYTDPDLDIDELDEMLAEL